MMLKDLVIHSTSLRQLNDFIANPTHALMLTGVDGVGLGTIAKALARELAGANVVFITPTIHNKQKTEIINADDIEDIGKIVRNRHEKRLIIIMNDADCAVSGVFERMLKLIEEPAEGVNYIFTAHKLTNIPTTIMSRSSLIRLQLPTETQCYKLLQSADDKQVEQIKFIANRRPAWICTLLNDESSLTEQSNVMHMAKQFISGNTAARVDLCVAITDRNMAVALCAAISKILVMLVNKNISNINQLYSRLILLSETADAITANGNIKLQLIKLASCY